jgi:hypothetical protein
MLAHISEEHCRRLLPVSYFPAMKYVSTRRAGRLPRASAQGRCSQGIRDGKCVGNGLLLRRWLGPSLPGLQSCGWLESRGDENGTISAVLQAVLEIGRLLLRDLVPVTRLREPFAVRIVPRKGRSEGRCPLRDRCKITEHRCKGSGGGHHLSVLI